MAKFPMASGPTRSLISSERTDTTDLEDNSRVGLHALPLMSQGRLASLSLART